MVERVEHPSLGPTIYEVQVGVDASNKVIMLLNESRQRKFEHLKEDLIAMKKKNPVTSRHCLATNR